MVLNADNGLAFGSCMRSRLLLGRPSALSRAMHCQEWFNAHRVGSALLC